MTYTDSNDASLMVLVCSGKHDAFAEIVNRHTDRFFALAFRTVQNRGDAEDIVQNAFIKLWQKPSAWDGDKSQFTTWFYRVVINACHDHLRKTKALVDVPDDEVELMAQPSMSEQTSLEQSQHKAWQQQCLNNAIKALPSSQRDALNLVVYLAIPQKQVAQIMGVSVKAIESLLIRAKRSITLTIEQDKQVLTQDGSVNTELGRVVQPSAQVKGISEYEYE